MKVFSNSFAFIFPLWLAQTALASLSKTGNITLFSDTHCKEPVYVNSFILGIDTCGKEDSATPYLYSFRSFILNERPWCTSGARPDFSIYSDSTCLDMIASNLPDPLVEEKGHHPCVAPGDFKGMAFICAGLDGDEGSPDDASTSVEKTITEFAPTASETTLTTASTVTTKDSSASTASSTPTSVPSSTISSSGSTVTTTGPSSTASVSLASPVPTSGAATTTDGALVVKLGLCLFLLVATI
ncbi:hypothetical protein F5Y13DRAFT_153560 [Hypoxylon sp. FL1857]|nr:hypothetical protein F5Y13DRAFT_153560 [Hypoxylon sp. FL1857]